MRPLQIRPLTRFVEIFNVHYSGIILSCGDNLGEEAGGGKEAETVVAQGVVGEVMEIEENMSNNDSSNRIEGMRIFLCPRRAAPLNRFLKTLMNSCYLIMYTQSRRKKEISNSAKRGTLIKKTRKQQ